MNIILHIIPFAIIIIAILILRQTNRFNKKSILLSIVTLLGSIILTQLMYYAFRFITGLIDNWVILMGLDILIDVVVTMVILFVATVLYLRLLGFQQKMPVWVIALLICGIIASSYTYYCDYKDLYIMLDGGMGNISFLDMFIAFSPRFVALRRIIALIPAVGLIAVNLITATKKKTGV